MANPAGKSNPPGPRLVAVGKRPAGQKATEKITNELTRRRPAMTNGRDESMPVDELYVCTWCETEYRTDYRALCPDCGCQLERKQDVAQ